MREYTAKACLPKHLRRQEEGYVFMYVSNESPTLVDVYFACMPELQRRHNDVVMTHTKGNLIQYNACLPKLLRRQEYYPFGLQTANSWTRENTTGNNFLGNGGTELNTTSNLYDLDYRNYDPILGRMNQIDPMATKYASLTPYNFSFNDPVTFNDPSGADPEYGITRYTYDDRVDHYRGEFYSGGSTSALRFHTGGRNSSIMNWSYAPSFAQIQRDVAVVQSGQMSLSDYGGKYGTSDLGRNITIALLTSRILSSNSNGDAGYWKYTGLQGEAGIRAQFVSINRKQKTTDLWGKGSVPYNGDALGGTNFIGPGPDIDPRTLGMVPIDEIDQGAFYHDIDYYKNKTGGVMGALFNQKVKQADLALALTARSIIERYQSGKGIDSVTGLPISERTYNLSVGVWSVFAPIAEMKYRKDGYLFPPGGLYNPPATPPAPFFVSIMFLPLFAP